MLRGRRGGGEAEKLLRALNGLLVLFSNRDNYAPANKQAVRWNFPYMVSSGGRIISAPKNPQT